MVDNRIVIELPHAWCGPTIRLEIDPTIEASFVQVNERPIARTEAHAQCVNVGLLGMEVVVEIDVWGSGLGIHVKRVAETKETAR